MNIQEKANYLKTLYLYSLENVKSEAPDMPEDVARQAARVELKRDISKRISIGDGVKEGMGPFEIKITALIRGLRPFEVQGLSIDESGWSLIDTKDGVPKEEVKNLTFESLENFSAIRLYDPISGVYSNVYKLA